MAQTKIVLNRQSDLILDNALITNPQGIVLTDISGVSEAVASINEATSVAISSEASDRVVGDLSLASDLSSEASLRVAAVSAEASLRVAGDLSLESNLSTELVDRAAAVSAEASLRVAGDLSLQNQIDFITNNIDDAAIDSLTEIVAAFQSADGDINGAITTLGSAATVAVDNEASIRLAADQSLAGDLSSEIADREAAVSLEEAARIAGDSSLELELSAEIEARVSDVDAEQARAESAEASLEAAKLNLSGGTMAGDINMDSYQIKNVNLLETLVLKSTDVDLGIWIQSNIDAQTDYTIKNITAPIDGGDATNKTYVDSADASLAANLSSEVSARLDAGTSVSAELSISVSDRIAADESLASTISSEIESLALTDEQTIELNTADNTIKLKDTVAAPASGIRTFMGEVDVDSVLKVAGVDVMATLSSEVSRAESAELSIVESLGSNLSSELSTEISNRALGDDYLQSQLDNLAQTDGLTLDVDSSNNTIKLKDTVSAPITGIRTFEGLINVGAEPSLDAAFGDLSLVTKKFVEDADASIMSIVNNVISNTDAAALDSLTEIVAAFQSADGDLNGAITNMANAATTDLNAEISTRIEVVTSLDDKIDAFPLTDGQTIDVNIVDNTIELKEIVAAPDSGIRTFMGEVDVETVLKVGSVDVMATISDIVTDLFNEVTRAESAELSLDIAKLNLDGSQEMTGNLKMGGWGITQLDSIGKESGSINLESSLNANNLQTIINLPAPTNGGDAANKTYVDSVTSNLSADLSTGLSAEIARAEAAELSLAEELSSEVSYLISNIDITDVDSFSEIVRDLSSEILRAESADASLEAAKLDLSGGTMTGAIDMGGNYIDGVSQIVVGTITNNGSEPIEVYNKLNANNGIANLPAPTDGGDAANKLYVDSEVSTEVARAEAAEASIALDFANVYAKHVVVNETPDDIIATFTLATAVREGSELVYVNGLLFDSEDYTVNLVDGKVASVTFVTIPSVGDKVRAYGVY